MEDSQREDLPRISVDTLHDYQRIKASYTAAALNAFERRVSEAKKTPQEKEILRNHLQKLIDRTFEMTKPNLRVNGKNFEDLNEDEAGMEPFDEAFDQRIWALSDESLQADERIAKLRREEPTRIATVMEGLLERQRTFDDKEKEYLENEFADVNMDVRDDVPGRIYEDSEKTARQTFAVVEELQQNIASQMERSERLNNVTEEIKSLKS